MCIPCYIKWKKASENTDSQQQETKTVIIEVSKPLPLDMLNRLIRLCHPDRHKCSEAAHIATVWLLAEREKSYQAGVE